ncbi:MAG: hypothetical protein UW92_C0001G0018 [Candidatus Jorgensenbacteria bacterium GW2011_GWA2_45_13]|uniref:Uncharacterized protein n=1 Tax=Candidatus Jorgensenbacteria bacterium GW2011_GWA2_45_13 TaxID=1618662 RepID=A0A0G1NH61_9BACT|nr:MAG: hypothetical protein UW92_C0001G0018 [Candidatus Jorgensenbacteria bacterium GW2011_GWA2_45_13]HIH18993.1 hypothetical protein [Candidatus Micrarchaeota archaeon]HIH30270.1 hypothetical protein [Candidatus Micrarchaeota archaeon]
MRKAQLSLEALLAMAAFLSILSLLTLSAGKIGSRLHDSCLSSAERHSLAYQALSIDEAAGSLRSMRIGQGFSATPSQDGKSIRSQKNPSVSEYVFHRVSASQSGGFYVQGNAAEPV